LESLTKTRLVGLISRELVAAGRDRAKSRARLRWLLFEVEMSNPGEASWSDEFRAWLLDQFGAALAEVEVSAVELEEYEWAAELRILALDLQAVEPQCSTEPGLHNYSTT